MRILLISLFVLMAFQAQGQTVAAPATQCAVVAVQCDETVSLLQVITAVQDGASIKYEYAGPKLEEDRILLFKGTAASVSGILTSYPACVEVQTEGDQSSCSIPTNTLFVHFNQGTTQAQIQDVLKKFDLGVVKVAPDGEYELKLQRNPADLTVSVAKELRQLSTVKSVERDPVWVAASLP